MPKGATLATPPTIAGAPINDLLAVLKSPHYRWRYQAKRELRERNADEVKIALDAESLKGLEGRVVPGMSVVAEVKVK